MNRKNRVIKDLRAELKVMNKIHENAYAALDVIFKYLEIPLFVPWEENSEHRRWLPLEERTRRVIVKIMEFQGVKEE